jgi:hypothetical protein
MAKEKPSTSKKPKSFSQKLSNFYQLYKRNQDKSFNELEKIAKERGYSFRRQQMQEALRLFKSEKTYEQAKVKHSRIKSEKIKTEQKKSINSKRPISKKIEYANGVDYIRTQMPTIFVDQPFQLEEAIPAAEESIKKALKYASRKKYQLKKKNKKFEQVQFTLYGWVDIYRFDDEDQTGHNSQKIFSGKINSNAFLDFFFPENETMTQKILESWIKNFMKVIQSLNGYFEIKWFQSFVSTWEVR